MDDRDELRELVVVEAWFRRHGLRLRDYELREGRWYVTVVTASGEPANLTGVGRTRLEAAEDARGFLE